MGDDLGVNRQVINGYLQELKKAGYINWERRGLGKTNVYYILDFKLIKPIKSEVDVK